MKILKSIRTNSHSVYFDTLRLLITAVVLSLSVVAASNNISDPSLYIKHIKFLASPEREGRDAGSQGLQDAAQYIADQFDAHGLQPKGDDRSFFQSFTVTARAEMGENNQVTIHQKEKSFSLKNGVDYSPINFSSSGSVHGSLVFVGYGAVAKEFDYDDYRNLDVKDKIVIVVRYEPKYFSGDEQQQPHTHHAHLITKAIEARNRGAKAVILVNGNQDRNHEDQLLKFGSVSGPDNTGILVLQVKNELVDQWLQAHGTTLATIQADIDEKRSPHSFALQESLQASISISIKREKVEVANVAGYLPGQTQEYIVLGAHYDHLGLGAQSSLAPSSIGQVHHGADDNASGTSGLLELARLFSMRTDPLERGVLFLAFAGEEIGLLGSSYWVNNPTLNVTDAVAMLNMDMIGRIENHKLYVGGVGTGTGFDSLITDTNKNYGFQIDLSVSGYSASDHTSFTRKKIPVFFFFSGLHSDYHKPSDTWEKINSSAATKLVNFVFDISSQLIESERRPKFINVKASAHGNHVGGTGSGYGPWFGSIPDFGQIDNGVKFADIQPGSPAAKAGLMPDDILIEFKNTPVKNLYDFTYALRACKIGDVVEVKVLREGKKITATVLLMQRR
tara:strand:- start:12698 stop:14551 length:1854 start_codon:yes stop_codon:yes gene_type:complete